jgi:predicted lactoylglutathione lyase
MIFLNLQVTDLDRAKASTRPWGHGFMYGTSSTDPDGTPGA